MSCNDDTVFHYVSCNFEKYLGLLDLGQPERMLNKLERDCADLGLQCTKLQIVSALVRLQQSGILENMFDGPTYLTPFTTKYAEINLLNTIILHVINLQVQELWRNNWEG